MKISEILENRRPSFSFEFFPPKEEADAQALLNTAKTLAELKPAFVSVTWGAGGGTRRKTIEVLSSLRTTLGLETLGHLTCVGVSQREVDEVLLELTTQGVENILALRGDPPKGETHFTPHPDGFRFAADLVRHIRSRGGFCLGAAAYPEGHPETPDPKKNLDYLKMKVEAGVDFLITQLFFDPGDYFRFLEQAQKVGISIPLLPGVMPVTNWAQLKKFTELCGARLPRELVEQLSPHQNDPEGLIKAGIDYATNQCARLLQGGAPGIHFYTLNRSRSALEIFRRLNISLPQ